MAKKITLIIILFLITCGNLFAFIDNNSNGIMDSWEQFYNLSDANGDPDNDTYTNLEEFLMQTNPLNKDDLTANIIKIKENYLKYEYWSSDIIPVMAIDKNHIYLSLPKDFFPNNSKFQIFSKDKFQLIFNTENFPLVKKMVAENNNLFVLTQYNKVVIYQFINDNLTKKAIINNIISYTYDNGTVDNITHTFYNLKLNGNYLYIFSTFKKESKNFNKIFYSMVIYDVSNIENPQFIKELIFEEENSYICYNCLFDNNLIYIVGIANKNNQTKTYLRVIDISDKTNPNKISFKIFDNSEEIDSKYHGLAKTGNYLLISNKNKTLIVDVKNPQNPILVKKEFYGEIIDIKIKRNTAYFARYNNILIYDISDVLNPIKKGEFHLNKRILSLEIDKNYLYTLTEEKFSILAINYFPKPSGSTNNSVNFTDFSSIPEKTLTIISQDNGTDKFIEKYIFDNDSNSVTLKRYYIDGEFKETKLGTYKIDFYGKAIRMDIDNRYFIFYNSNNYLAKAENGKFEYMHGYFSIGYVSDIPFKDFSSLNDKKIVIFSHLVKFGNQSDNSTFTQHQLHLKVQIDGKSDLYIQNGQIWWINKCCDRPGQHDGVHPIFVNDFEWYPTWNGNISSKLNIDTGKIMNISLVKLDGRGNVNIIQEPTLTNNFTAVIEFDDAPFGSDDWYEVIITLNTNGNMMEVKEEKWTFEKFIFNENDNSVIWKTYSLNNMVENEKQGEYNLMFNGKAIHLTFDDENFIFYSKHISNQNCKDNSCNDVLVKIPDKDEKNFVETVKKYLPDPSNSYINPISFDNITSLFNKKLVVFDYNGDLSKENKFLEIFEFDNESQSVSYKKYYIDGTLIEESSGIFKTIFNGKIVNVEINNKIFAFYNSKNKLAKFYNNQFFPVDGALFDKNISDNKIISQYNIKTFLISKVNAEAKYIELKDDYIFAINKRNDKIYIYKFSYGSLKLIKEISSYQNGKSHKFYRIKIKNDYMFVLSNLWDRREKYSLIVFNISNPENPLLVSEYIFEDNLDYPANFILDNNLIYIIGKYQNNQTYLLILDSTNKYDLKKKSLSFYQILYNFNNSTLSFETPLGIVKKDEYLLLGNGNRCALVNISNPEHPKFIKNIITLTNIWGPFSDKQPIITDIKIKENFVIIVTKEEDFFGNNISKFYFYDISNIQNPVKLKELSITSNSFIIKNNNLFIANQKDLKIYNILNIENPMLIYTLKNNNLIYDIKISNDFIFLADIYNIKVFDLHGYDKDFDGIPDTFDLYPEDKTKYFGDEDGNGKIDKIIDNKTYITYFINSPELYKNRKFDEKSFKLQVLTNEVNLNNIVHKLAFEYENDNYSLNRVYVTQINPNIYKYSTPSFDYSLLKEIYKINPSNYAVPVDSDNIENAFNLVEEKTYNDIISTNVEIRWYKISFNSTSRVNLLFASMEGKSSLILENNTQSPNINVNIYRKKKDEAEDPMLFGSISFNPSNNFKISFTVDEKYEYFVKIEKENVKQWKFYVSIQKEPYLYFEEFTLDENGNGYFDFVTPLSDTYKVILNSPEGEFTAKLYLDRRIDENHKLFDNNSYKGYFNKVIGLLSGEYRINVTGNPGQKIQILIFSSSEKKEIEPNNTINTATRFFYNISGNLTPNDNDIFLIQPDGYFTFNIFSLDFENGDEIDIFLYDNSGNLINSYIEYAENHKIITNINVGSGIRFLKIFNPSEKTINYTLNGAKPPIFIKTDRENIYETIYKNYLLRLQYSFTPKLPYKHDENIGNLIILPIIDNESAGIEKLIRYYYNTFQSRGYLDNDIFFFYNKNKIDINGDGIFDNIIDEHIVNSDKIYNSISEFAINSNRSGPLFLYIIGEDIYDFMQLIDIETFKDKIEEFHNLTNRDVILIVESSNSGYLLKFFQNINYVGVITSSNENEKSLIDNIGGLSFSFFFGKNLLSGFNLKNAFENAIKDLYKSGDFFKSQHPQFFTNNQEINSIFIGNNSKINSNWECNVKFFNVNNNITDGKIELKIKIFTNKGIKNVWAIVLPPNFNIDNVSNLSSYIVKLKFDKKEGIFKGNYDNATQSGVYKVYYYIENIEGDIITKEINPEIVKCDPTHLNACFDQNSCENAGGIWDNGTCKSNKLNYLNVVKGWNLLSLPINIENGVNINEFDYDEIETIWKWDNNRWSVWSNNQNIQNFITEIGLSLIKNILPGEGFWINANKSISIFIGTGEDYGIENLNISNGWNLLGIGKDINVNLFNNVKIVLKWKNNNWLIWSPVDSIKVLIKKYNLNSFKMIYRGEGFWVNK